MVHRLGNGSHIGAARPFEAKREGGQFRQVCTKEQEHAASAIAKVSSNERERQSRRKIKKNKVEDKRAGSLGMSFPAPAKISMLQRLLLLFLSFTI